MKIFKELYKNEKRKYLRLLKGGASDREARDREASQNIEEAFNQFKEKTKFYDSSIENSVQRITEEYRKDFSNEYMLLLDLFLKSI